MQDDVTLEAVWTVDSETGEQYLRDVRTGEILAQRNQQGIWVNPEASK